MPRFEGTTINGEGLSHMKLSLVVSVPSGSNGKTIQITRSPFLIGRDPKCQLRPSSALVSNRHCSLEIERDRALITDLGSTNGTFLNKKRLARPEELHDNDLVHIGPLAFTVRIEGIVPVDQATPLPPTRSPVPSHEEEIAAVLLAGQDDEQPGSSVNLDSTGVPTGGTEVLKTQALEIPDEVRAMAEAAAKPAKEEKKQSGDTSTAADAILKKYLRRPRKA
jgi:pSer/pThr/pTyr-binding forkhead associated (FHA) protein